MTLIVIDANFISITKLLPTTHTLLQPNKHILNIIKPQFKIKRTKLEKNIVHDPNTHATTIDTMAHKTESINFTLHNHYNSQLPNPDKNLETFLLLEHN